MQIPATGNRHELSYRIWSLASHLHQAAGESLRYTRDNLVVVALFPFVMFPLYYVVWRELFPQDYENLTLRLTACLAVLPGLFVNRWPEDWQRRWLPWYFVSSVTYCLPFFFTYMLLMNAEFSHAADSQSYVWPMSLAAALVLLIMLINDGALALLSFLAGSLGAAGLFLLTSETFTWEAIQRDYLSPMPVFLFIIAAGSIYNHHRDTIQQEMLRAVSSVGSNIAHELRTPLLGIKSDAAGLDRYLPVLLDAYEKARDAGLDVGRIRGARLVTLRDALKRIDRETDYSNTIIDMLLLNSGNTRVVPDELQVLSALSCLENALDRFPFASEAERNLVHLARDHDFRFRGSEILLTHIVFNLLKNAIYYIAEAGKGEISIWLETLPDGRNRIYFMDTGTGIPPTILPRIFDRFFTSMSAGRGSGIGLSFCKMVMEGLGGSIACDSEHGRYTRFALTFPPVSGDG